MSALSAEVESAEVEGKFTANFTPCSRPRETHAACGCKQSGVKSEVSDMCGLHAARRTGNKCSECASHCVRECTIKANVMSRT